MSEISSAVKEEALQLLKMHECSVTDYEGMPVTEIRNDLYMAYPDGFPFSCDQNVMAEAIYQVCTVDRGWKEPVIYAPDGYATKWGNTDLRDDIKEELEKLVISGVPFRTEELSCAKEFVSWRMSRKLTNGEIAISVYEEIDEGKDLVWDALPDGEELTDEEVDEILNLFANNFDCHYEYGEDGTVPENSTLDDILTKVEELSDDVSGVLSESFETMKSYVADILSTRDRAQI